MGRKFRLPMFVVAAAMLGLIAVLATLQYQWLGRISEAERERMKATLNTRATGFAQDFDRELTRAYLLFQAEPAADTDAAATRLAARYDRWQASARYPRLIAGIYLVSGAKEGQSLKRFNPSTRFVEPAEWPASLDEVREQLRRQHEPHARDGVALRPLQSMVLDDVPAIVVPAPFIFINHQGPPGVNVEALLACTIVLLDRDYIVNEMLPSLAEHHFRGAEEGFDYRLAVVRPAAKDIVYHSAEDFSPSADASADAAVDMFQVRLQEFSALAAEVRRFSTFVSTAPRPAGAAGRQRQTTTIMTERIGVPPGAPADRLTFRRTPPQVSILVDGMTPAQKTAVAAGVAAAAATTRAIAAPKWKLMVAHPAGSLETAVQSTQRRNVLISSGILALLGASMGLLVLSTRRAQRLAAQQLEFVAAVSHELRTPLAVIRSAGENLADGVVRSDEQIKQYGDLVRNEGRRLTEMVEQILEFAGIQSGQRGFALRPVAIKPMLEAVVDASRTLIDDAGLRVEIDAPATLPPVLGDEAALRRVFQNLLGNAIKYGASGGWIGLKAQITGRAVRVTVSDRGIGIAPAEHVRIFEPFYRAPDVIAAQIQGAGLGLSLVKRIVDAHGGRITLRSAPGHGSEFTVQLPSAGQEALPAADAAEPHPTAANAASVQS